MANPAQQLAEYLTRWNIVGKGQNVYTARGSNQGGDHDLWSSIADAMRLVGELRLLLDAQEASGKNVAHYRQSLPHWVRVVIAPDVQWNSMMTSTVQLADPLHLAVLHGYADVLDATNIDSALTREDRPSILAALDEVSALLTGGELTLGSSEKRYVFELITSIRNTLASHSALGDADLLRRIHELFGFLTVLTEDIEKDPDKADVAKKLRRAARRIVPYARFSVGFAAGALASAADVAQLAGSLNQ